MVVLRWFDSLRRSFATSAQVDRRAEQRRFVKIPIEVRITSGTTYRGFTRDLSDRGMGAVVSADLRVGDQIWIRYEHPVRGEENARAVVRHATVRQRNGYRYGFEFSVALDL